MQKLLWIIHNGIEKNKKIVNLYYFILSNFMYCVLMYNMQFTLTK